MEGARSCNIKTCLVRIDLTRSWFAIKKDFFYNRISHCYLFSVLFANNEINRVTVRP